MAQVKHREFPAGVFDGGLRYVNPCRTHSAERCGAVIQGVHLAAGAKRLVEAGRVRSGNLHDTAVNRGSRFDHRIHRIDGFQSVDAEFVLVDARLHGTDRNAPDARFIPLHRDFVHIPLAEQQCGFAGFGSPEPEGNRGVAVYNGRKRRIGRLPPSPGRKGVFFLRPAGKRSQHTYGGRKPFYHSSHTKVPAAPGSRSNSAKRPLYWMWIVRRDQESLAAISTICPSGVRNVTLGTTPARSATFVR